MAITFQEMPKFRKGQRVRFIGGEGIIQNYHPEAGNWTYSVEMSMGPEPDFGRIGYETTVLMSENDIKLLGERVYENSCNMRQHDRVSA